MWGSREACGGSYVNLYRALVEADAGVPGMKDTTVALSSNTANEKSMQMTVKHTAVG